MASTTKLSCPQLLVICWIVLGSILTTFGIILATMKSEKDLAAGFLVSLMVWTLITITASLTVDIWWRTRSMEVKCPVENDGLKRSQTITIFRKPAAEEIFV